LLNKTAFFFARTFCFLLGEPFFFFLLCLCQAGLLFSPGVFPTPTCLLLSVSCFSSEGGFSSVHHLVCLSVPSNKVSCLFSNFCLSFYGSRVLPVLCGVFRSFSFFAFLFRPTRAFSTVFLLLFLSTFMIRFRGVWRPFTFQFQ